MRETYWQRPPFDAQPAVPARRAHDVGWFAALLLGVLLAFGVCPPLRAEAGQDYAAQAAAGLVGRSAPALRLTTIDGDTIDLGALRSHKAVYLKFWATWCSPCREQMPHFERMQQQAGDDLQVIAINIGFDDTPEQIAAFRREFGLTMPIVRDDDGALGAAFGLRVTPQHVIIDKDGRIAYVGHLADAKLEAAIAAARGTPAETAVAAQPASPKKPADDPAAPSLRTIDGASLPLADPTHRRSTTLLFFSPWCEGYFAKTRPEASGQCRALRERMAATHDDGKQRVIGVAFGLWTSEDDVRAFRDENHIAVPLALDRDGAIFRRFAVHNVPVVVELDAQGRVAAK